MESSVLSLQIFFKSKIILTLKSVMKIWWKLIQNLCTRVDILIQMLVLSHYKVFYWIVLFLLLSALHSVTREFRFSKSKPDHMILPGTLCWLSIILRTKSKSLTVLCKAGHDLVTHLLPPSPLFSLCWFQWPLIPQIFQLCGTTFVILLTRKLSLRLLHGLLLCLSND